MLAEEFRKRGLTAEQARAAALRSFGGVDQVKEQYREIWRFRPLDDVAWDARLAARALVRDRGFSAVTVVTLAVAIGANTAIFSVANAVLLRPLPYPEAERIVRVAAASYPEVGVREAPFSVPGFRHFERNNRSFEALGAHWDLRLPLTGDGPAHQLDAVGICC